MSRPTVGRLMALERLLKNDAIMLPRYRQAGGMGIILSKTMNEPHDFVRTDTAYVLDLGFLPGISAHAKLLEVGGSTVVASGSLASAAVTSIVSKDADAETLDTYAIPAEVQALTGYGWSARDARNYIDFTTKKFVQCVASVDMGTLTWAKYTNANHELFYTTVSGRKLPPTENDIGNIVCPEYAADTMYLLYRHTTDMTMALQPSNGRMYVYDAGRLSMTAAEFKTAMSGVMLQYELATPIETDISAYLTDDNTMPVESGGSLTFENSNQISVPSKIEYIRRI